MDLAFDVPAQLDGWVYEFDAIVSLDVKSWLENVVRGYGELIELKHGNEID